MTHICDSKLTIIGSYNVLSPGGRQAIQEHAFESVVCEIEAILSRPQRVNISNAGLDYIRFPNVVIAEHADGSTPNGAGPPAGTVLTIDVFPSLSDC